MIDTERINSQLSLSHGKVITSVDPGGGSSMIDAERINSQLLLLHGKVITSVDPGGSGLTVNVERVNSQCREDQQSTCTFARKIIASVDWGGGRMPPQTFRA